MKKPYDIIMDISRELYMNATPSADFDKLVENAEVVDGIKQIPYDEYEIEEEILEAILRKHFIINKVNGRMKSAIRFEVMLGCSPKTKQKEKDG